MARPFRAAYVGAALITVLGAATGRDRWQWATKPLLMPLLAADAIQAGRASSAGEISAGEADRRGASMPPRRPAMAMPSLLARRVTGDRRSPIGLFCSGRWRRPPSATYS